MKTIENSLAKELSQINEQIMSDCKLKKGRKAAFMKHMETIENIIKQCLGGQEKEEWADQQEEALLAIVYKNLAKLGDHPQSLEMAIKKLKKLNQYKVHQVKWTLQLAALKSSFKKHNQCFELAQDSLLICRELLEEFYLKDDRVREDEHLRQFIKNTIMLIDEKEKDEVVWLVNDKSMALEMVKKIKKQFEKEEVPLSYPFYRDFQFHIADYMTLECSPSNLFQQSTKPNFAIRDLVIYVSICFFTKATEKYYMNDFSEKTSHFKSLKIAVAAFEPDCSYVQFLIKILSDHFAKKMTQINEQNSEILDNNDNKYYLPRDKKQRPLKDLTFAQE